MSPTVSVPVGTVKATHRHPSYGPCIITHVFRSAAVIRTDSGSATVPLRTLTPLT